MKLLKRCRSYLFDRKFKPKRKYLLFSSIDSDRSAYSTWLEDKDRNFDVVLYVYKGELTDSRIDNHEKKEGFKYQNFYEFSKTTNIAHYNAIWIVDDDIVMSTKDINKMFDVFEKNDLLLGQPSYDPKSSSGWDISMLDDNYYLRFTNFIENGVAIFSRSALKICLPSMKDIKSGWGADFIWPTILDFPEERIAVIDEVQCYHPESESSLNEKIPRFIHRIEGESTMEKYNTKYFTPRVFGGKRKHPNS